jgi:hypothetical protein
MELFLRNMKVVSRYSNLIQDGDLRELRVSLLPLLLLPLPVWKLPYRSNKLYIVVVIVQWLYALHP